MLALSCQELLFSSEPEKTRQGPGWGLSRGVRGDWQEADRKSCKLVRWGPE